MTGTVAERKCALFLTTLRRRDRRRVLAALPRESAACVRALVRQLEALALPIAELAADVLADDVRGLTATTSLQLDDLLRLSDRLDPVWFARVLAVWPNVNRTFCLSMLPTPTATIVRRELALLPELPAKLADAVQAEALAMCSEGGSR
jgi:hypothetical protein